MLTSTDKTFLMVSDDGTKYEKLVDIKEYPDLGQAPEALDASDLTSPKTVPGRQSLENMAFPANYEMETYKKLKAMEGEEKRFSIWFGGTQEGETITPTGEYGKFNFRGSLTVQVTGAGVEEVREMEISIAPLEVPYLVETSTGA